MDHGQITGDKKTIFFTSPNILTSKSTSCGAAPLTMMQFDLVLKHMNTTIIINYYKDASISNMGQALNTAFKELGLMKWPS